jgi:hypothetical protein
MVSIAFVRSWMYTSFLWKGLTSQLMTKTVWAPQNQLLERPLDLTTPSHYPSTATPSVLSNLPLLLISQTKYT